MNDELFSDLGPLTAREDIDLESLESQRSSFVPYSISQELKEQDHLINLIDQSQISYNIKVLLIQCVQQYGQLLQYSSQMTLMFGLQEQFTIRTTQLAKLCMIGTMQITQILDGQDLSHILGKFEIKSINIIEQLNPGLQYLCTKLFPELISICKEFLNSKSQRPIAILLIELRFDLAKLYSFLEMVPHAIRSVRLLKDISQNVVLRTLASKQDIEAGYARVISAVQSGQAMMQKKSGLNNEFLKTVVHNFGSLYYLLAKNSKLSRSKDTIAEPKLELAIALWNIGESGLFKQLMPMMFQHVAFKLKINIPRYFIQIDLDYVRNGNYYEEILKCKVNLGSFQSLKEKGPDKVKIRILNSSQIVTTTQRYSDIIIHVHGGGFVAMSSRSHQSYTRKWANLLNVPIFSIDYRLSPEYKFPAALDDCWQVYMWIVNFCPHYFNLIPRKIILVGDSAGGNLISALTNLLLREKVRIPNGLVLIYPALDLNPDNYYHSRLLALDDGLLPHTFLKLCCQSYIQDEIKLDDPLISPVNVLPGFPPTRILTGTNDPLHDDSWALFNKLTNAKMYLYQDLPHGFLQFYPLVLQCQVCIEDAAKLIQELLSQESV